jgi:hypothetical protein
MPGFQWTRKSTPNTQIKFLSEHSQISIKNQMYNQHSMQQEFADLMKKEIPVGVVDPRDMSYFVVQMAGERIEPSLDYSFMMLHSGLETGARDGRLWCGHHEIETWHVEIQSCNFNVYARLANLDFHPTTAVIEQVVRRALIKWRPTEEEVNYIEERRRPRVVPTEIPCEQRSEIACMEPYDETICSANRVPAWTDDTWMAYYRAHPSLDFEYQEDPRPYRPGPNDLDDRCVIHDNGWTVMISK